MKPLQPSPNATTTANANIVAIAKKPTVFPSLLRKTKGTPNKRLLSSVKQPSKPPVKSVVYDNNNNNNKNNDNEENNDHHSRISELTYERVIPASIDATQHPESDMSSLSQASVQHKAKMMRRQKKVQDSKDKGTVIGFQGKIMDLQKVQPQLLPSSAAATSSCVNSLHKKVMDHETPSSIAMKTTVHEDSLPKRGMEHTLPTIFSAASSTPQSQKEVTPVADNRYSSITVVEQENVSSSSAETMELQPDTAGAVREESNPEVATATPLETSDDKESTNNISHNKKFDKVKALLHRMNPLDRVKALQKNVVPATNDTVPSGEAVAVPADTKKTTWLQALEDSKPKILISREMKSREAAVPTTTALSHRPAEPPATLHQPSRSLAEPHPEIGGIVSLVDLDGPRPPNAPTPVHHHRGRSSSDHIRRTSFEPPDSADEMHHHLDAPDNHHPVPSRDAPVREDGANVGEEDEFFHGMLTALEPDEGKASEHEKHNSMRQRLLMRSFKSMPKGHALETDFSSSAEDSDLSKPAVDAAAMMAALEATLPPRPKRERKKKGSSPRRAASADSPRRRQQKFAKKASQKADQLQQSRKQHPVITKTASLEDVKQGGDLLLNPKVSSSHDLTATPSLPRNIVLSKDSLISDLDQSIRNFPMRQVVARPDLEGLSSLEWTKNNSDSEEDDLTEDRYAITEDRYIPLSPASFISPRSPRSPKIAPPLRLLQSYTNPDKIGDALADSITEWSVDNTARSGDTAEVALEVVLNSCNQTPFGQICIRDTKTFQSKECLASDNGGERDPLQKQGVRFAEEDTFVNKILGMMAASGYDKESSKAGEKTPLTSNRHFFGEAEEDQTLDSAPSRESKLSRSENQMHPMRCFTNVPTGPKTPSITRSAIDASVNGKDCKSAEHMHEASDKLEDASGRYTCRSSKIGMTNSVGSGDESDEDNTRDRYSVSKSAKGDSDGSSSLSERRLNRNASHSSRGLQAAKSFSFDKNNDALPNDGSLESQSKTDDDCNSSTISPLRPEYSDKRAQRDDASFRSKIINRLELDDQSLGIDTTVNLFSKVSSLHDDSESIDLAKYLNVEDCRGDTACRKLQVSIDCNVSETPSLKQRLLSFGKQVVSMSSDKKMKIHEKISKLKPSAKGVLIRSIDRANPDIIDLTNIEDSDDLEDMEAVWLFDLSPKQAGAVHSILTFANDEHKDNLANVEMVDKYQAVELDEMNKGVEIVQGKPADINALPEGKVVLGKSFSPKDEAHYADIKETLQTSNEQKLKDACEGEQVTNRPKKKDDRKVKNKSRSKPGILYSFFEQAETLVCGGNAFMLEKGEDEDNNDVQSDISEHTEPPSLIFAAIKSPSSTFSTDSNGQSTNQKNLPKATEIKDHCIESSEDMGVALSTESKENDASLPEENCQSNEVKDHDAHSEGQKRVQSMEMKDNEVKAGPITTLKEIAEQAMVCEEDSQLIVPKTGKDLLDTIFEQTESLICGDDTLSKLPGLEIFPIGSEVAMSSVQKNGDSAAVIDLTNMEDTNALFISDIEEGKSGLNCKTDGSDQGQKLLAEENHDKCSCRTVSESSETDSTKQMLRSTESERDHDKEMVLSHGESMGIDFDEDSLPGSALQLMLFTSPTNNQNGGRTVQPPRPEDLMNLGLRHKRQTSSVLAGSGAMHDGEIPEKKGREAPRPEAWLPSKKEPNACDGKGTGPRPETYLMRKGVGQQNTLNDRSTEDCCISKICVQDQADCKSSEILNETRGAHEVVQQQSAEKVDFVTSITCALFTQGHGWMLDAGAEKDVPKMAAKLEEVTEQEQELENSSSTLAEHGDQQVVVHVPPRALSDCSEKESKGKEVQSINKSASLEHVKPVDASLSAFNCDYTEADKQADCSEKLVVNTVHNRLVQSSSDQLLDSSSEESLQLITESNLPTNSYEKNHSVSSSADESLVERGEPLISTSKILDKNHLRSFSNDTVESKNTSETIDPVIGPTSTVSVSASSIPFLSYAASSEVNTEVSVPPIVGPSLKHEKDAVASNATSVVKEEETIEACDKHSPRIESQSSSFSLEATGAEINNPFTLSVIEENRKEEVETDEVKDDLDILMRVLSSGSFDRGFERMYSDRNKRSVILGVSVPCQAENLIVVQGEEVIAGTIPMVTATEEPFSNKSNEVNDVSSKPVVQSQRLNTMDNSILDDTKLEEESDTMASNSRSDLDSDICVSQNTDEPSKAVVASDALSNSELADAAPFGFFPCSIPIHDDNAAHVLAKDIDGIDPCGALGIGTRQKKDASPTFAGSQPRSASAPRPRTTPILEQKPQSYTSSLMKKLQQRKLRRDEIRSSHSFSKQQAGRIEHKASLSGNFSLTSTASSKSTTDNSESNVQPFPNYKSSDPPSSQEGQLDNDYALMEIVSDDSSTEADGSSLLLALTRSEGDEPLMLSPKSPSLVLSPSSQIQGETVKESASEKTEPVRNTTIQAASQDESYMSQGEEDATQSASLRKTLDRIRANSSKSVSGDMSVISTDTDHVDIDGLFSRYDSIVKNMVVLDDLKLSQPKINKDMEIIDVTDQRSEHTSSSGSSFLSELPKRLSSIGKDPLLFPRDQVQFMSGAASSVRYHLEDTIESEDEVIQVTSFGSETTTPSEKARSLRYQLDQALKASAAIRNSQERLGVELHTFKNRLQLQRRELSPVRDHQSSSGYSHNSSVAAASRGNEHRQQQQRQSRQATSTSRQYYDRERECNSAREELLDRVENNRAKSYSPRSQQQRQTYALADDDDDEDEDDLFDFDESSEDDLEIDSAASSNEVKFQQLQSILKGLRQNEERKVHHRPYY